MTSPSTTASISVWRRIPLWQKILAGLALGILAGALMAKSHDTTRLSFKSRYKE